ncbi:MAG: TonB-dependent receptor [Gammaproteobacteria bacterium]|nr:TonB-dependent receptor [Gammaproteobacteria bacterium]
MSKLKNPTASILVAAAVAAALPGMSHAATETTMQLDEVVVTARKREENLQEVPVAVSAISEAQLEARQITDLADMNAQVPNLTIYAARGSNSTLTAYMRGVGQADPLWGVDPGVALYLDDVYIARPQGALLDVYDIQRIEVLRGPQGTLYGKNTIGGAIKYVSAPLGNESSAKVEVGVGNYNERDLKASLNMAPSDTFALRLAGAKITHDGYGENVITGSDVSDKNTEAVRASARWTPSDDFEVRASLDYTRDGSGIRGAKRLAPNRFDPATPDRPANSNNYDVDSDFANINWTQAKGASVAIDWSLSDSTSLKSITAYRESATDTYIDFDTLPSPIANVRGFYSDHQFSQELQAIYDGDGAFQGVAGLYYFDGTAGGQVRNNFFGLVFGDTQGATDTESWAAFGEGTYGFTDALNLTVGLRYTSEKKSADVLNRFYTDGTYTTLRPVAPIAADFNKSKTFSSFSPRVVIDWTVAEDVMLYASAARGFKSGGYNIRANSVAVPRSAEPFDDEQITTYEAGAKTSWADGRYVVNAAYFYSDYKDIQLSVFTSYDANGDGVDDAFFGDFTNAGAGEVQGVELELTARPVDGLTLQGMVAWLDTKYTEFMSAGVNVASTQIFTNAPEWQYGFNGLYTHAAGAGKSLTWQVGYTFQTKVFPTTDLSRAIAQNSYGVLNASLALTSDDGRWRVALWGKNLLDEEYRTTGYNIPTLGVLTGFYGAPQTYGVTASYSW